MHTFFDHIYVVRLFTSLVSPLSFEGWFPEPGRAFWGMQSDGFCRLSTRAGSAPVVKRNWHWGPLVHQTFADALGLLFSRAVRLAVDDLVAGRMPPEPPSIDNYERILDESKIDDAKTQIWKKCMCLEVFSLHINIVILRCNFLMSAEPFFNFNSTRFRYGI